MRYAVYILSLLMCRAVMAAAPRPPLVYEDELQKCYNLQSFVNRANCLAFVATSDLIDRLVQKNQLDDQIEFYNVYVHTFGDPSGLECLRYRPGWQRAACMMQILRAHLLGPFQAAQQDWTLEELTLQYRQHFVNAADDAHACTEALLKRIQAGVRAERHAAR